MIDAARTFMPGTVILDGETVVLDEQGAANFGRLQNSLGISGRGPGKLPVGNAILLTFDPLYLLDTIVAFARNETLN